MIEESSNFTNPDLLNQSYIPANISGRDLQIEELRACFSPALKRKKPMHAWLHGRPGVGKTLTAKFILRKIEQ